MRFITICGFVAMSIIMTLGREVITLAERVVDYTVDFVMTPFRADYGNAFEIAQRWVLAAFRLIGLLKPEYDDSLHCDAQNFDGRYRLSMNC